METQALISQIQHLPVSQQIYIAEKILSVIRNREKKSEMELATEILYSDYLNDNELTIFTNLDFENFYETSK